MTDRIISLDAAIEAAVNAITCGAFGVRGFEQIAADDIIEALTALPAVDGWPSLQQAMNELNATKDALAEAEARIYSLEDALRYERD